MRWRACLAVVFVFSAWGCAPSGEDVDQTSDELRATPRRICSWNIRRLGHQFDNRPKDMAGTASIIEDNCDVVAVQEVMQSKDAGPGHLALLAELGGEWDGVVTETAKPDDPLGSSSEHYAFLFKKSVAEPCSGWQGVKQLADVQGAFLREPAWTCLTVAGHDLLLVGYHAVFGSAAERRREVGALDDDLNNDGRTDDVLREIRESRAKKAEIIVVGDFNLEAKDIAKVLPTWRDATTGTGSTINLRDEITDNLYDHVLIPPDQPGLASIAPAEVLDVRGVANGDTYFRSISDHLPIRFVLSNAD